MRSPRSSAGGTVRTFALPSNENEGREIYMHIVKAQSNFAFDAHLNYYVVVFNIMFAKMLLYKINFSCGYRVYLGKFSNSY